MSTHIELPDAIRVPLDELHADAAYLFGRVAADGGVACAMTESVRSKLGALKSAIVAHVATPAPAPVVADDWVLVPRCLSQSMIDEIDGALSVHLGQDVGEAAVVAAHRAMLCVATRHTDAAPSEDAVPVAWLAEELGYLPGDGGRELWWKPNPHHTCWKQTPLYLGIPTAPAGQQDAARIDLLQRESFDLQCFDIPTGAEDYDIGWRVVQHRAGQADEVFVEVYRNDARAALDAASKKLAAISSPVVRP